MIDAVEAWVRGFVVKHDLCPFAAGPLRAGRVRFALSGDDPLESLLDEVERIQAGVADTTLLVLGGFADFEEFLDLVAAADELLEATGLESSIQLASFHPDYRFAGVPADDPANATNRAPHPVLHLLRVDDVSRAVDAHPDPDGIPDRNVALLRKLAQADGGS